ncbi:hypothetical protein [Cesiribacter andamanensis]|uniref:DUF3592 domain-containing protein n=1 Tax=Cesiribacter andamanensis AMV16 TaxID=1279009 RepID=M7NAY3_9BACT|nr:hypothetical protein [Cesiribacter andamanensis]EMR04427.1 hypothetical protein ADICEAN_00461 [Cesiribacter andamanensis AMV16]
MELAGPPLAGPLLAGPLLAGPLLAGLILAGLGLLGLVLVGVRSTAPAPGLKQSRGILLEVIRGRKHEKSSATVRYTAGLKTYTSTAPLTSAADFFPGQQVLVTYAVRQPQQILELQSLSAAMGRRFLLLLVASLFIVAGLLLIRLA